MFTLLEVDSGSVSSNVTKTILPNVAAEIISGCRLGLEWDELYARYVISLSKLKLEDQLFFAAKLNIMLKHRIQAALNAIMKCINYNKLKQYEKKEWYAFIIMK